jgi:hypothetical protein
MALIKIGFVWFGFVAYQSHVFASSSACFIGCSNLAGILFAVVAAFNALLLLRYDLPSLPHTVDFSACRCKKHLQQSSVMDGV